MKYFDLHCDTMVACVNRHKKLVQNDLHIDIERGQTLDSYVQCFAVFIEDSMPEKEAFPFFKKVADRLAHECRENEEKIQQCRKSGDLKAVQSARKIGAVLTVENGLALSSNLHNLDLMAELGVKMMTLTWNGDNHIGTGAATAKKTGLTSFGKQALKKMEKLGIVADISHASDYLFEDVAALSQKPIVASHSNVREICPHRRNLTNKQIGIIKDKKGLIGLNFYKAFLNREEDKASIDNILLHAEAILALGGEDVLAMGSDFDGADMPKGIQGLESIGDLYELFLRHNYQESLVKKIFFENAESFFIRNNLL